jgi:restriction endonuclease Mrr
MGVTQVAVPAYQRVMLPLMQVARDEREHSLSGASDTLAREFRLSPEERAELLPSGRGEKPLEALASTCSQLAIKLRRVSIAPLARPGVPDV